MEICHSGLIIADGSVPRISDAREGLTHIDDIKAITAAVAGRVQGVGYRYTTQRVAADLGLDGWVRNQQDGTVSVMAQGPPTAVRRLVAFLEQGPPAARVTSCEVNECPPNPDAAGFSVKY
ncbi:MAG: acylphosphatase [Acidimicrobiia bacterium]|nr:acylphosphatase [Acidimicrobiia bacterium]MDX2466829.1 acylphosphatase [Acidimicrobiia bacterium]